MCTQGNDVKFVVFVSGVDYFLRTSFSVTVESFLLRIRDVVWDGMKSELSNWTYRAKIPDHLAVRFTSSCEYPDENLILKPLLVCIMVMNGV